MAIWSRYTKWGLGLLLLSGLSLFISFAIVPLPERLQESHSPMLLYKDGSVAHIQLAPDERWRSQADLSRIDPAYVDALLAIEDERFYWHAGFDPLSIVRALFQNLLSGEIVSGASTLTMQLVKELSNHAHAPIGQKSLKRGEQCNSSGKLFKVGDFRALSHIHSIWS